MKIPDWVDDRTRITVLVGVESVIKREQGVWYEKVQRCNRCGKCCMNVPENWKYGQGDDGNCSHLKYEANEYLCGLGISRPYSCCIGDGNDMNVDCNIKWKEI